MNVRVLSKIIICILLIMLTSCFIFNIVSFGDDDNRYDVDSFLNEEGDATTQDAFRKASTAIVVSFKVVCVTIAIIILIVIAMKYMISAPADRADIKKHAVPYVIGAIILFSTTGIISIIQQISKTIKST